jgi:hypothetical protein
MASQRVDDPALMGMKHMGDAALGGMVKGRHKSIKWEDAAAEEWAMGPHGTVLEIATESDSQCTH